MVAAFRPEPNAGPVIQPEPPFLLVLLWDLQPFASPDALHPFVVHTPARVVQQAGDHPISIAPVLVGQLDDIVGQTLLIGPAMRHLALRGSVLTQGAAGAALGNAKLPPHIVDALATTRRMRPFSAIGPRTMVE